jgi:hypothetical protein
LIEGSELKVSFEIDSREYNEKWYTNLRAWKIEDTSGKEVENGLEGRKEEVDLFDTTGDDLWPEPF